MPTTRTRPTLAGWPRSKEASQMRPIVRPGLQILRRDIRTLQVGRDWPGATCLPDSAAVQAVLGALDGFRDTAGVVLAAASTGLQYDACAAALEQLIDVGAVVDQAAAHRRPSCEEWLWTTLWLLAGPDETADHILRLRRRCRVHVDGAGPIADSIRALLPVAGPTITNDPSRATLLVMTDTAEPSRERADQAMRTGLPHLWAYARELSGVVGPFVVPGRSACLRCTDHARAEVESSWPTLLQAASRHTNGGCDRVLAELVGAWTTLEVVMWASGFRPSSWDAVVEIPYDVGAIHRRDTPVHPQCGCGWPGSLDTIGA
jgi:hypothetical protein